MVARRAKVAQPKSGWGTPMKVVPAEDHMARLAENYWSRVLEDSVPGKDNLVGHILGTLAS